METQGPISITVIIPVFNEEKTVAKVIHTLLAYSRFSQVICVNDGSTDRSRQVLQGFGARIRLIDFDENKGKGQALAAGIEEARGDWLVFVDADFTNLTHDHLEALLAPMWKGKADAVLGFPKRGEMSNLTAHLTGERVYYKKDLLPLLDEIAPSRFGVEVLLNERFQGKRVKMIPLQDLVGLTKCEKRRPFQAIREYLQEGIEILDTISKGKASVLRSLTSFVG
jgi:cellulose synthase/poly-beta-1,6-N-acetylglucosamine synthase-like glycosyltransferase